jgi:YT521-B-like domain
MVCSIVLNLTFRDVPLPFQRTRMLRNPWNGNREVKISRDGTEIEPSVGARILQEFDAEPTTAGPGLMGSIGTAANARRMSYPIAPYRQISGPQSLIYQQQSPHLAAQGLTCVPYAPVPGPQPMMFNYGRGQPQQQQFGGSGQQYPYGHSRPQ